MQRPIAVQRQGVSQAVISDSNMAWRGGRVHPGLDLRRRQRLRSRMSLSHRGASGHTVRIACVVAVCLLSACAADGIDAPSASLMPGGSGMADPVQDDGGAAVSYDDNATYEGRAIYRCDNGETLQVDNTVAAVSISFADGTTMQLPASPADSHTRYVQEQYAMVFDGQEALFFRPKAQPLTCRR
jgi:membrane-bound inhibitor of C-type lysozyme